MKDTEKNPQRGLSLAEMAGLESPGVATPQQAPSSNSPSPPPSQAQTPTNSQEYCSNCHVSMQGPFCHRCGQPTRHFIRFFPVVVSEIMVDSLGVDGRFWRTLLALLFRPGRLTWDYLNGRRVHYSPPIRLYLLSSLVAFLIITSLVDSAIEANLVEFDNSNGNIGLVIDGPEAGAGAQERRNEESTERQRVQQEVIRDLQAQGIPLPPELTAVLENADTETETAVAPSGLVVAAPEAEDTLEKSAPPRVFPPLPPEEEEEDADLVIFGNEAWDAETNPLVLPFLTAGMNQRLNREIGEFKERLPEIKKNPRILVDRILEILPQAMFLMLPAFALIMKLFYSFSRRYYMEHLLFALHNHAFVFAMVSLLALTGWVQEWIGAGEVVNDAKALVDGLAQVWLVVYLFLAQKKVYGQGWIMTTLKFLMVGASYSVLLIFGMVLASLVGVILV